MHVLQYIAVQADDEDMAMRSVEDTLNSEMGGNEYAINSWYDWFVIGGGRFVDGDPYKSSPNYIVSYDKDPEKYRATINEAIQSRIEEFNRYRKHFEESNVDISTELDKYVGNTDYAFGLYPLSKLIDMLHGKWDFNSYYYDVHHGSTNREHMLSSIDNGNKNWYAVPVDFHY